MASKKFKSPWVGPVKIQAVLDQTHYLVSDWEHQCLLVEMEANRLKPYNMNIYENGEMLTLSNIYKHLEHIRLQQENKVLRDHISTNQKREIGIQT